MKNQDFLDQVSSLLNPTDDILVVISLIIFLTTRIQDHLFFFSLVVFLGHESSKKLGKLGEYLNHMESQTFDVRHVLSH